MSQYTSKYPKDQMNVLKSTLYIKKNGNENLNFSILLIAALLFLENNL